MTRGSGPRNSVPRYRRLRLLRRAGSHFAHFPGCDSPGSNPLSRRFGRRSSSQHGHGESSRASDSESGFSFCSTVRYDYSRRTVCQHPPSEARRFARCERSEHRGRFWSRFLRGEVRRRRTRRVKRWTGTVGFEPEQDSLRSSCRARIPCRLLLADVARSKAGTVGFEPTTVGCLPPTAVLPWIEVRRSIRTELRAPDAAMPLRTL